MRDATGATALMVVVLVVPSVICDVADVSVVDANVGVDVVAMFCGVASVIVPAPFVTVIWLAVPVNVAGVAAFPALPIRSCPLVRAADSTMAPPTLTITRLLFRAALELVPPFTTGNTPVTDVPSGT